MNQKKAKALRRLARHHMAGAPAVEHRPRAKPWHPFILIENCQRKFVKGMKKAYKLATEAQRAQVRRLDSTELI